VLRKTTCPNVSMTCQSPSFLLFLAFWEEVNCLLLGEGKVDPLRSDCEYRGASKELNVIC